MGIVTKTHTQMVGDVTEEIQYYFESYEDFIKFEEFIKAEEAEEDEHDPDEGGTRDSTEVAEGQVPRQEEKAGGVAGRRYRVIGNEMGHGFEIGEEVVVLFMDMSGDIRASNGEEEWWMIEEELEEV